MKIETLDPRDCTRWKYADRSSFEFGDTNALADDIRANGQINPVFARPLVDNPKFKYEVIAGSRRLQACLNGNLMINAIITDASDDKAATIQIKENDQIPLSEFSKGIAFSKLKKDQIVKSIRGTQGGYVLLKKPNEIKLTNIFHAVDEKVKTVQCKKESKKGCNGKATKCVTHNLWDELETHINTFFEKKSLEDLLKNNTEQRT